MSLKSLIEARKTELQKLGDPGDDEAKKLQKAQLEASIKALEEADADKEVFNQDDLNNLDQQGKEKANEIKGRIEKMFGTDIESVEQVLQRFDNVLPDSSEGDPSGAAGDGSGKGDADVLNRALNTITEQGKKIESLTSEGQNFQRSYHEQALRERINRQFGTLGLQERYEGTAHNYLNNTVGIADLVDKRMKGETVSDEEIQAKTQAVKDASDAWFTVPPNPEAPDIPVTPAGDPPKVFTDEERKQVSVASGGSVF